MTDTPGGQPVEWRKGDIVIYEHQGHAYLGCLVDDDGLLKPLALSLVSRDELGAALGRIASLSPLALGVRTVKQAIG